MKSLVFIQFVFMKNAMALILCPTGLNWRRPICFFVFLFFCFFVFVFYCMSACLIILYLSYLYYCLMLCPCDNITGYLNGLQYLFRLLAGIASGTFLFALPLSHALSLLSPSSPSLLLRYPCSYTILALTLSLLLRHPCSYAILALRPSLLQGHPCS